MIDGDIEVIINYSEHLRPNLRRRYDACEKFYTNFFKVERFNKSRKDAEYCFFAKDVIAWYLYHLRLYNYDTLDCDMNLCSRIVPVFKTLGANLNKLKQIKGFENRYSNILKTKDHPSVDHLLCEIVIALAYYKDVSKETEFIPVSSEKTPDILIKKNCKNIYVEVKKRIKNYKYQIEERIHWTRLSLPVSDIIMRIGASRCYRIVFHKELETYHDNYLKDIFENFERENRVVQVDNDLITIVVEKAELVKTQEYLKNFDLRMDTTQLKNMLFNYDFEKDNAISYGILGKSDKHGLYYSKIDFAYGLIWNCDSKDAIDKHAKSLKNILVEAIEQIPKENTGVVHFIIESYQGSVIDIEVYKKLDNVIKDFNFKNRNIQYLYLHFWKFRIPPNENWLLDQDCIYWERDGADSQFLLKEMHILN